MSSKNVKIAQPYAEAFLELSNKGSLDTVINDLNCVSSSVSGSAELKTLCYLQMYLLFLLIPYRNPFLEVKV